MACATVVYCALPKCRLVVACATVVYCALPECQLLVACATVVYCALPECRLLVACLTVVHSVFYQSIVTPAVTWMDITLSPTPKERSSLDRWWVHNSFESTVHWTCLHCVPRQLTFKELVAELL